jgi:hypothetical protein
MDSWLFVEGEGDRLCVRTSEAFVARRRRHVRGAAILCSLAGCALVAVSPWFLALVAVGLTGYVIAARLVSTTALLEVDRAQDRLVPLQSGAGRSRPVAMSRVRKVSGVYEVFGWDPRSTIYADLESGERVPLLVFAGTDERLAEEACLVLGRLLDAEATYAGPYGEPKTCFRPDRRAVVS